jgi:hypothetical protein
MPPVIDGNLDEYRHGWVTLCNTRTGARPKVNSTKAVATLTPDRSALMVGVVCHEDRMNELKADCTRNDELSLFEDDVVEVYVDTPRRSYFKVAVNPNGAVWDECTDVAIIERDTLPILWNPGVKAAVRKEADRWTVEIMIPTKDFGDMGPTEQVPWGIQIGRNRFTGGKTEAWAVAPTDGGPFRTQNRWASLWMR